MPYESLPAYRPLDLTPAPKPPPKPTAPKKSPPQKKRRPTRHIAKIHSWESGETYGFLKHGKKGLFLHRRDFAERHKKPEPGDLIHFEVGKDSKGRRCAINAVHHNDGGRFSIPSLALLTALLCLPLLAILQLSRAHPSIPTWAFAAPLLVSLITYRFYAADKKHARAKRWRTSESTLHFLELIGGWPGAFIAQRRLRHKCSKENYQSVFWLIVIGYQYIALDYLFNWNIGQSILYLIKKF
ncbi:MAG: DUF1294 domain-containing protein [Akkermansiaceae bacterium]